MENDPDDEIQNQINEHKSELEKLNKEITKYREDINDLKRNRQVLWKECKTVVEEINPPYYGISCEEAFKYDYNFTLALIENLLRNYETETSSKKLMEILLSFSADFASHTSNIMKQHKKELIPSLNDFKTSFEDLNLITCACSRYIELKTSVDLHIQNESILQWHCQTLN